MCSVSVGAVRADWCCDMAGDNREERQARSLALERAYVHDVYDRIAHHFADTLYRPWPRVRQFLEDLEPGSLVADVGECRFSTILTAVARKC